MLPLTRQASRPSRCPPPPPPPPPPAEQATFPAPPRPSRPRPALRNGRRSLGGKTPGPVPTPTKLPMAEWVETCCAGRKARGPRASRNIAGRKKGLFPRLELRTGPRHNSRLRRAGRSRKVAPGEEVLGQRRPRDSHRRTLAFWERPSARPPPLYTSVPRFPPEWAVLQALRE